MSVDSRYFVDVFGSIVDDVRANYTSITNPVDSDQPFYLYGHILGILKELSIKDESGTLKYKKYPLIALIQDFEEQNAGRIRYEYKLPEIKVIIVTGTDQNYDSSYRYANTFKPTLYPLYFQLLKSMVKSDYLDYTDEYDIEKSKFDRVYWGKSDVFGVISNVFNDRLDAIEIRFKNLLVKKHLNC